jgi:hypothetical protein
VTPQAGLGFDNFRPRFKSGIFKRFSQMKGSFFRGDDWCFLKEGVKTYLMASMSRLKSPNFFLSSHISSMRAVPFKINLLLKLIFPKAKMN